MNYEKFVTEVKRGVEDIVEKELGEGVVVVRNVLKNNSEFPRKNFWIMLKTMPEIKRQK